MISEVVKDIRINWKISDDKRDEGLTTPEDIIRFDNISYGPIGDANLLDIYHQKKVTKPQKTIISIHGGGWVYGSKEQYQFYGMRLAQRGFTLSISTTDWLLSINTRRRLRTSTRYSFLSGIMQRNMLLIPIIFLWWEILPGHSLLPSI